MFADVLLGLQWGDEGKGKIVDVLAPQYDVIARFQGGPNAGHTLVINGKKMVLHTIPSGIFHDRPLNLIGNGVVINPITLKHEIEALELSGTPVSNKLLISRKASLILPTHKVLDSASEKAKGKEKIGSTLRGIGPTYMDKTGRNGLRMGDTERPDFLHRYEALKEKHLKLLKQYDFEFQIAEEEKLWFEALEYLKQIPLVNSEYYINDMLSSGKKVLAEGAQGAMLDIDFGTYPFVTSSNTITAAACTGLGIAPNKIREVIGISKAYTTRVGSGPFPTELHDETGEKLRTAGNEFGATTGRPRRCGWLDLNALKYTSMISGLSRLIITKLDVLNDFPTINICTSYAVGKSNTDQVPFDLDNDDVKPNYTEFAGWNVNLNEAKLFEELPLETKTYIEFIENYLSVPVSLISHAPDREKLITKDMNWLHNGMDSI